MRGFGRDFKIGYQDQPYTATSTLKSLRILISITGVKATGRFGFP